MSFSTGGYSDTGKKRGGEFNPVRDSATSAIMSAVKAIVYIICVIAVAIPLAIFVINTANDAFAFVKDEKIITVTIDEYATIDSIGDTLGEAGVIKYPWAFKLWCNLKEPRELQERDAGGVHPRNLRSLDDAQLRQSPVDLQEKVHL